MQDGGLRSNFNAYQRITASVKWGCENKYINEGKSLFAVKLTLTGTEWEMTAKQYFTVTLPSTHGMFQQESDKYSGNVVNSAQVLRFCQAQRIIYYPRVVGVGEVLKGLADNQR